MTATATERFERLYLEYVKRCCILEERLEKALTENAELRAQLPPEGTEGGGSDTS